MLFPAAKICANQFRFNEDFTSLLCRDQTNKDGDKKGKSVLVRLLDFSEFNNTGFRYIIQGWEFAFSLIHSFALSLKIVQIKEQP